MIDLERGTVVANWDGAGAAETVAYAEVGQRPVAVVVGANGRVRVWRLDEPAAGPEVLGDARTVVEHAVCVRLAGHSAVVTATEDGSVCAWDLTDLQELVRARPIVHAGEIRAAACASVHGHPVVMTAGLGWVGSVHVWDLGELKTVPAARTAGTGGMSRIGDSVLGWRTTDSGTVVLRGKTGTFEVDPESGGSRPQVEASGPQTPDRTGSTSALLVLAARTVEVVAGGDCGDTVLLKDAEGRFVGPELGWHPTRVTALAAWPGEEPRVVSGDADGTVIMWNPALRREEHRFRLPAPITGLLALQSGILLADASGEVVAFARPLDQAAAKPSDT